MFCRCCRLLDTMPSLWSAMLRGTTGFLRTLMVVDSLDIRSRCCGPASTKMLAHLGLHTYKDATTCTGSELRNWRD